MALEQRVSMRVVAPAKINLHLRVGPPRSDGFHPLLTWMCTVELFDTLTLIRHARDENEKRAGADRDEWFSLSTDHPSLPTDRRNLVVEVATALADTLSRDGEGPTGRRERVSAYLIKRIPAGAGLGGGSSDAAAVLGALSEMWKLDWSATRLGEFASRFGSDIAFFFHGPSSICTGRGEIVQPTPPPVKAKFAVLVLSDIAMPTPAVYKAFDAMKLGEESAIASPVDFAGWSELPADELLARLVNDLEAPAFSLKPELDATRKSLERVWEKQVRMSGSGSSLFTLCDEEAEAIDLVRRVPTELKIDARVVRLAPPVHISTAESEAQGA